MTETDPNLKSENKRRPRGTGSLTYDAKRDLWIGIGWVIDANGERVQRRVTSRLKSTAQDKLNALQADIRNGTAVARPGRTMTVGAWLDYWLENVKKPAVRPKTFKSYELSVRAYLKPHIGDVRLDKLTPAHIETMHKELRKHSTRNAQKAQQTLGAALTKAVKDGYVARNVCASVDMPKHKKKDRGAFALETAVHVLKTAAKRDDENVATRPLLASRWVAAFMTGARQGELIGLELDRISVSGGFIDISWQLQRMQYAHGCGTKADGSPRCGRVRYGYCPDRKWDFDPAFEYRDCYKSLVWTRPKSMAGDRLIPMAPLLQESLRVHLELDKGPNPHGLVWRHRDGRPLSQEDDNQEWNALIAAAGIPKAPREVVLHEARNTTATMLLESGVDIKVIQGILGHASILQSRDYQRVSLELSKNAVSTAFDALLPGS